MVQVLLINVHVYLSTTNLIFSSTGVHTITSCCVWINADFL